MHDEFDQCWADFCRSTQTQIKLRAKIDELLEKILLDAEGNEDEHAIVARAKYSFHIGYIASLLVSHGLGVGEAQKYAKEIMEKSGFKSSAPADLKRTEFEERLYGNSRQQLSATIKSFQTD
jgi:hypothetical protein